MSIKSRYDIISRIGSDFLVKNIELMSLVIEKF